MFDYCASPYRDRCDPHLKLSTIIIDIMLKMSDLENNQSKGNIMIASCICDILQETKLCRANALQIKLFVQIHFRTRPRYIKMRVNGKHGGGELIDILALSASPVLY
jgi:hypothetical protein